MEKQNNSELGSYTDALKKVQELQVENLGIIAINIHTFSFGGSGVYMRQRGRKPQCYTIGNWSCTWFRWYQIYV